MDSQRLDTLRFLYDAAPERVLRFVIETVFREGAAAIPTMASKLEELLRMCVVDAAREELLAKISALEAFQHGPYFTHVVAAQQAAGLLDPRVASPGLALLHENGAARGIGAAPRQPSNGVRCTG